MHFRDSDTYLQKPGNTQASKRNYPSSVDLSFETAARQANAWFKTLYLFWIYDAFKNIYFAVAHWFELFQYFVIFARQIFPMLVTFLRGCEFQFVGLS